MRATIEYPERSEMEKRQEEYVGMTVTLIIPAADVTMESEGKLEKDFERAHRFATKRAFADALDDVCEVNEQGDQVLSTPVLVADEYAAERYAFNVARWLFNERYEVTIRRTK
jgi:hypothetical protein